MSEDDRAATESGEDSGEKQVEPRKQHLIQFFESERACIEQETKARGMNATQLVCYVQAHGEIRSIPARYRGKTSACFAASMRFRR